MMSIFLLWFVQTSVMPLVVGAATAALTPIAWGRACPMSAYRRAAWVAMAAWLGHVVFVGVGLLREGSVWDCAAVVVLSVVGSAATCRSGRTKRAV